jgi:hypothetical protein
MKCEACLTLIEEFVDGSLVEREASRVEAHLSDCPTCAEFYKEVKAEQEVYARYERDIEVSPRLWAAIESRIKQERPQESPGLFARLRQSLAMMFATPRLSPALAALLVARTVGLTAAVMTYVNSRDTEIARVDFEKAPAPLPRAENQPRPADPPAQAPAENGSGLIAEKPEVDKTPAQPRPDEQRPRATARRQVASEPDPGQLVREAEQKYIAAIAILSRDVSKKRSGMDPMVAARFDAALGEIDKTIAETRRAVRSNPDDPIALQYMLSAYSKKVDTLREMSRGANATADED